MNVSPTLHFRAFESADLAVLGPWLNAAGFGVPKHVDTQAWVDRLRSDPCIMCLTACDRLNAVIGFTRLDVGPDRAAEVTVLVAPGLRRRGLGRELLQRALAEARRRGLRRLVAQVQQGNRSALAFFAEAGFEPRGEGVPGFVHLVRYVHRTERQPPLEISP